MIRLLEELFDNSKIKETNRVNYLILCEYFKETTNFKCKHFKKLKRKFKTEIQKEIK
ncbi:MAG: hypothetical protein J7L15_02485 [Clostridiales bacterium]|nr:hypothetical protein [Clostridiales bacterium]